VATTAFFSHYSRRLTELAERRQAAQHARATLEAITTGSPLPAQPVKSPAAIALDKHLAASRVKFATPPPEPQTRLFLAGKPIATPGNLVTVIAKSKTGKTASLGAAVAAILGAHYDRPDIDTFKFTAPHTDEAVILFDTEQSPYDAWTCHKRTMERAGGVQEPDWPHHYALVGDSAKTLRDCLPVALATAREKHKGVFALILDGVADFVASVNDEAECNDFVTYLRKLAVDYNTPIICVIHSNEGIKTGDDGRGHLGKQLTRKAESNLLLKKVGEVTTITSEKQRKAPITEADQVAFKWSDEHGRHVSCANPEAPKKAAGRRKLNTIEEFWDVLPKPGTRPLSAGQIHRVANDLKTVKLQTFKDLLAEAVTDGKLERSFVDGAGFLYVRKV
jgi:hypothetical protein